MEKISIRPHEAVAIVAILAWAGANLYPIIFPYRTDAVVTAGDRVAVYDGNIVRDCIAMREPFVINDGIGYREYIRVDCGGIFFNEAILTKYVSMYRGDTGDLRDPRK